MEGGRGGKEAGWVPPEVQGVPVKGEDDRIHTHLYTEEEGGVSEIGVENNIHTHVQNDPCVEEGGKLQQFTDVEGAYMQTPAKHTDADMVFTNVYTNGSKSVLPKGLRAANPPPNPAKSPHTPHFDPHLQIIARSPTDSCTPDESNQSPLTPPRGDVERAMPMPGSGVKDGTPGE
jgi:hypothetical protein